MVKMVTKTNNAVADIKEEYVAPMGFDVIDFQSKGGGKGKNNCKTDCR